MQIKKVGLFIFFCSVISINIRAQEADSTILADTLTTAFHHSDTTLPKRKFVTFPPHLDTSKQGYKLRNQEAKFGRSFGRGLGIVFGYNTMITSILLTLPEDISKWNKKNYGNQFKKAYTNPPAVDHDKWYINYLGHPYQGTIYYNSMRSQGAKVWQSGLFCLGSVWLWEYTIEAGFEQPSVQDLIVTPGAGILLGELFHFSTVRMSRNGYKWYEKMFVCLFNPTFAINNGFKYAQKKLPASNFVAP